MTLPDKRTQILDAAEECFERFGYRRSSMDDIARAGRMSKGSVYSYFDSKDELFRSVIERYRRCLEEDIEAAINCKETPQKCIQELILKGISTLEQHPVVARYYLLDPSLELPRSLEYDPAQDHCSKKDSEDWLLMDALGKLVEDGERSGAFRKGLDRFATTSLLMSCFYIYMHNVMFHFIEGDVQEFFQHQLDVIFTGICKAG